LIKKNKLPVSIDKWCNVRRAIKRRIKPFVGFLASNVERQALTPAGQAIRFVPFGRVKARAGLWPVDIWALATGCRRALGIQGKCGPLDARVIATVASACMLATDRWCRTLRSVPCPMTAAYRSGLARRIRCETLAKRQIVNVGIVGVCAKSVLKYRGKVLQKRIAKLVGDVAIISGRAIECARKVQAGDDWRIAQTPLVGPILPRDGYTTKFVPYVLKAMGFKIAGDMGSPDGGCSLFYDFFFVWCPARAAGIQDRCFAVQDRCFEAIADRHFSCD